MPIDPTIPLAARAPQSTFSPTNMAANMFTMRRLQGEDEDREFQRQITLRDMADTEKIRAILRNSPNLEAAVPEVTKINPKVGLELSKSVQDQRKSIADAAKAQLEVASKGLEHGIKLLQGADESSYPDVFATIAKTSPEVAQMLGPTYDKERVDRVLQMGMSAKEIADKRKEALEMFGKGDVNRAAGTWLSTARNQQEWDTALRGMKSMGVPDEVVQTYGTQWSPAAQQRAELLALTPKERADLDNAEERALEAERHNRAMEAAALQRAATGGRSEADLEDAEEIAQAIIRGDQPPLLTGLYRLGAPVRAAIARNGYNLAGAEQDWRATTRHLASLNGPQQLRMRQAVDNAYHSLDVIEEAAKAWDAGRFPTLTKVRLAAATAGNIGGNVRATIMGQTKEWTPSEIARILQGQIADVTSELGNVYMGGNSPTDHALKLAGENLSADWSRRDLDAMIGLARNNLSIRANSMKNVGVAGASGDYVPNAGGGAVTPPPPPAAGAFPNEAIPAAVTEALQSQPAGKAVNYQSKTYRKNADGKITRVK